MEQKTGRYPNWKFVVIDSTVLVSQKKHFLKLLKGRRDKIFDSSRSMFATIRLCLHVLAWFSCRERSPQPNPTAVLLVVIVPFVVGA